VAHTQGNRGTAWHNQADSCLVHSRRTPRWPAALANYACSPTEAVRNRLQHPQHDGRSAAVRAGSSAGIVSNRSPGSHTGRVSPGRPRSNPFHGLDGTASSRRGTGPSDSRRETDRGLRPGLHMAAGRPRPREGRGRVPRPDQPERRESHWAAGGVPGPRLWASERRIVRKGSPARIRGAVHGREDAPLQAGEDRAKIFKGCSVSSWWSEVSEWSGCGLDDFDGALGSRGTCEFPVAGEQGGVHGFGQGYVGRVVDGEVVP
jgi:hypothetical protein